MENIYLAIALAKLLLKIIAYVKDRGGEIALAEIVQVFDEWTAAKTKEQQREAARKLADIYSRP